MLTISHAKNGRLLRPRGARPPSIAFLPGRTNKASRLIRSPRELDCIGDVVHLYDVVFVNLRAKYPCDAVRSIKQLNFVRWHSPQILKSPTLTERIVRDWLETCSRQILVDEIMLIVAGSCSVNHHVVESRRSRAFLTSKALSLNLTRLIRYSLTSVRSRLKVECLLTQSSANECHDQSAYCGNQRDYRDQQRDNARKPRFGALWEPYPEKSKRDEIRKRENRHE